MVNLCLPSIKEQLVARAVRRNIFKVKNGVATGILRKRSNKIIISSLRRGLFDANRSKIIRYFEDDKAKGFLELKILICFYASILDCNPARLRMRESTCHIFWRNRGPGGSTTRQENQSPQRYEKEHLSNIT
jgi:hypothetical protein